MIRQCWYERGAIFGMRYLFTDRGEGLPMHHHRPEEEHTVIVLKGAIRITSRGTVLRKDVPAPAIIDILPELHELVALEPGTELLNLYIHGKPADYIGLPDAEKNVLLEGGALENPLEGNHDNTQPEPGDPQRG